MADESALTADVVARRLSLSPELAAAALTLIPGFEHGAQAAREAAQFQARPGGMEQVVRSQAAALEQLPPMTSAPAEAFQQANARQQAQQRQYERVQRNRLLEP
jgi:hypothetical protein